MTTYHLKNWQDKRGSDLDRAKKLIQNKNYKTKEVAELTSIPYQTLVNYRANIDSLNHARYETINKLSQAYDIFEITDDMSQDDVSYVQDLVSDLLGELLIDHVNDQEAVIAINQIKQIVTSDPVAVYKIFKALEKNGF